MAKKFSLLLAAIAVVAFAAPAFASAAPELTIGGARAGVGAKIVGTSSNTVTKTSIGNLTCSTVTVHGEVKANTGTTVEAKSAGVGTTATCFFKGVTPITIHDPTLLKLHTATVGAAKADLTFTATLPKGLTCHYTGLGVNATYSTGGSELGIEGGLAATPEACGTASIEGTFKLAGEGGQAVMLH